MNGVARPSLQESFPTFCALFRTRVIYIGIGKIFRIFPKKNLKKLRKLLDEYFEACYDS